MYESRALGNKSKHEISATFFAYIISMNVKEVIMDLFWSDEKPEEILSMC